MDLLDTVRKAEGLLSKSEPVLNALWDLYREFSLVASKTQDMDSNSISDFLGWLDGIPEWLNGMKEIRDYEA